MPPTLPDAAAAHDWSSLVRGRAFISDLGPAPPTLPGAGGASTRLPRYAAWAPVEDGHRIAEVSDDLDHLKRAYDVPDERVLLVEA